jgi:aminoglycoside phosphotransferase (APT) family kinase protein
MSVPDAPDAVHQMARELGGFEASRLEGTQSLNNDIWMLRSPRTSERFVLRLANPAAVDFLGVNRDEEFAAAAGAAGAGVGPEIVYHDAVLGHLVTRWIDSGPSWEGRDFRDPRQLARLVEMLRRLHAVTEIPGDPHSIFRRIDRLTDSIARLGLELPGRLPEHLRRLRDIEAERVADRSWPLGLTHNDLWWNNLLDDGSALWLVDWEFSGSGDGLYDLATVSLSGELGPAEDLALLDAYGRDAQRDLPALQSMKWVVHVFEAAWSITMHGLGRTDFDHLEHARWRVSELDAAP